ncbi:MAG: hypothetical protein B0A82_25275 [Alkalinema sp. CACIAM 70d]|nr:MAG: hypothetical protein B0A82_25275 [Alkalinema sp. CACIAM 70d]
MHPSNKVIQGFWIGPKLSLMEQLSIRSFLAQGHEYHLYAYDAIEGIPKGTTIQDANEILPSDRIFTYQHGEEKGSYSGFADLFRSHLLAKKGGWWADLDVICLKPFDFAEEYVIASSYEGKWGNPAINCVMKMPPNSVLANYLCEESDARDPNSLRFAETGPLLLQDALRKLQLENAIVDHEIFCPISWRTVQKRIAYAQPSAWPLRAGIRVKEFARSILKPHVTRDRVRPNSYAVHLWSEMWRRNQLDKNGVFHDNCLYEKLKQQYL